MIIDLITAFILGIVQSITEFLPVSSSGHLILVREFLNFDSNIFNLSFDIILHFGSLFALILFFRKDLKEMVKSFLKKDSNNRLLPAIALATIPAILVGLVFSNFIEDRARSVGIIISMLILVGIIFIIAEKISKKEKSLKDLNFKDAFLIGIFQSIALIPGVSRSGITIVAGLFLGFKRESSARFSFLLSIPTILIVSFKEVYDLSKLQVTPLFFEIYFIGFIVSLIGSFFVIKFFLSYLKKHTLIPFAYYRFLLGIGFLFLMFF